MPVVFIMNFSSLPGDLFSPFLIPIRKSIKVLLPGLFEKPLYSLSGFFKKFGFLDLELIVFSNFLPVFIDLHL